MAKATGLDMHLAVDGYDISNDTLTVGRIGGGPTLLPITGIDKSAMERLGGLRSGSVEASMAFNDATDQVHDTLSGLATTDVGIMFSLGGTSIGDPAAGLVSKHVDFPGERGDDGSFSWSPTFESNGSGLHFGELLTPWTRSDGGTATDGASLDNSASTSDGLVAYLQVIAIASGSATITIEESSDDGAGDAWAAVTGGAFSSVTTARTTERIETATGQTVERYLRVASSGTFTGLEFVVMVARR